MCIDFVLTVSSQQSESQILTRFWAVNALEMRSTIRCGVRSTCLTVFCLAPDSAGGGLGGARVVSRRRVPFSFFGQNIPSVYSYVYHSRWSTECWFSSCCCSSSCAGWPILLLVHWIWSNSVYLSSFKQTRFIFDVIILIWQYSVAFTASIYVPYNIGNYGQARSQGGRQLAAANPPPVIIILVSFYEEVVRTVFVFFFCLPVFCLGRVTISMHTHGYVRKRQKRQLLWDRGFCRNSCL